MVIVPESTEEYDDSGTRAVFVGKGKCEPGGITSAVDELRFSKMPSASEVRAAARKRDGQLIGLQR
jgi:hypothetical protein